MDFLGFAEELAKTGLVVFTVGDAVRITGKKRDYCRLFLNRLARRGKLTRVERGKYISKDADLYAVASNLVFPSYVSFLSALSLHKLTTQIPFEVQVACAVQKKPVEFGNARIMFVKMKKSTLFGFKREGGAFVAEPEKAVVDGLYLPRKMPVSEAFYAIEQKEMSVEKLEEYAERLGSAVVKKRLGFLLEKAGLQTRLPSRLNRKIDVLNTLRPAEGEKSAKWRLVINEVLG